MKQKILYILMMITALIGGNGEVWAADNWGHLPISGQSYAEGDATWGGFTYKDRIKEVYFSGIPDKLTFRYDATDAATEEYWSISESADGKTWNNIWETEDNPNSGEASINLAPSTRYVRFHYYGNFRGSFQNISITERRYLTANKSSIDFGSLNTNATSAPQTVIISHCNAGAGVTITSSNNSKFKVSKSSLTTTGPDKMDTEDFTITYDNSEVGTHEGTITITDTNGKNSPVTISVKGVSTKEKTYPDFTWTLSNLATGREYTDFFSSTNTDTEIEYSSNNATIANVVNGKLITYSTEGQATIKVTQRGNDDWHEKSQDFVVYVSKPQNHLPISITESNWSLLTRNLRGNNFKWNSGIQYYQAAYSNREFEIAFNGIPDKISFDYKLEGWNVDAEWAIRESATGEDGSFEEIWKKETNSEQIQSIEVQLKPTTRFVRIFCYCISTNIVKNINITELKYLKSETSSIDFGENFQDDEVTPRTFIINHCNVGEKATITSSNPNFVVNPVFTTTTGIDKMGKEQIWVTYLNNSVGNHSGIITITDPSGNNSPIEVSISGSTISNALELDPTQTPNYEARNYKKVVLKRTLPKEKHFTLTLPFDYDISGIQEAYIAQLAFATHNQLDGYTLYFEKLESGQMKANQPYIVWLPKEFPDPEWSDVEIVAPNAQSISNDRTQGWTMQGNYEPGLSMAGKYGIAGGKDDIAGKFCLGTKGSTINAYTAYFTFHGTENVRARVAVMDEGGNTTYIGEVSDLNGNAAEEVFGIDGMRLPEMRKGINIVRQKDGSVRKIVK